jgi:AraC family transcriptional regulator
MHRIEEKVRTNWMQECGCFNNEISVAHLADEVYMSVRNLQLMFKSFTGISLHQYIDLRRLGYAQQLMRYRSLTLAEIADHLGFANPQALSNKFTKVFGESPSKRSTEVRRFRWEESVDMQVDEPRRELLPRIAVLFISYVGSYDHLNSLDFEKDSWDRIYDFAAEREILASEPQFWGIAFDDTDIIHPNDCRFYAAVSIRDDNSFRIAHSETIQKMYLPEGQYLVYTHRGAYELLDKFYEAVFRQLPCRLGDGYILEKYLNSPADVAEEELITEVWVPID